VIARASAPYRALLAHRAWNPPTSSSLAEEKRLRFLLLSTAARDSRRSQRLGVVRKLLHCPTVPVGIGEEHE
jgi:hypothetical protein